MNKLQLFDGKKAPKILCLGAHSDDIEIGCGGTILRIINEFPTAQFYWIVFSANERRTQEARQSANSFLYNVESKYVDIQNFRESYFPFVGSDIKDYFEKIKNFCPDIIFTHHRNDAHQDHQLISSLTWNTFRDHFILEYEIPKYDGDLVTPNFYVHLDESFVERKTNYLIDYFTSQKERQWFTRETFRSLMRIRGIESNSPTKYAEGFHCHKIII